MLILWTDLSLDAMDISGEHQLDVQHNIFKKRIGRNGQPITIEREESTSRAVSPFSLATVPRFFFFFFGG
jgi:hypothetical protein